MQVYKVRRKTIIVSFAIRFFLSLTVGLWAFHIFHNQLDLLIGIIAIFSFWPDFFRKPWEIILEGDSLNFRSFLRSKKIAIRDLYSFQDEIFWFMVLHNRSSLPMTLYHKLNGLYDLLDRIKAINPDIKIKGFDGYSQKAINP